LVIARVSNTQELISGIDEARARGATALNVLASPMLFQNRRVIIEQAAGALPENNHGKREAPD
jgi:hypothetical protein